MIGGASAFILTSDSDDNNDNESGTETTYYTIQASATAGGNISPSGQIEVAEGESKTFTFTPDTDYELSHIMVDGKRKDVSGSYTFSNVSKNHTISAVFEKVYKPVNPSQPSAKPTKYVVGMEVTGEPGTQDLFNDFNPGTMTVTLKYSDGTQRITTDYEVSPNEFNEITDGLEITIKYMGFEDTRKVDVVIGPNTPISNITELEYFADLVNDKGYDFSGKRVYLENNIDIEGVNWEPIGESKDVCFKGEFDGCGWTITNLKVNNPHAPAGLFGALEGTVQDLAVSNAEIVGGEYVGTIAGYIPSSGKIKNVVVEGAVINGNHWVGGIVGYAYGSVMNCTVIGDTTITATPNEKSAGGYENGDKAGGIIGYLGEGRYSVTGNKVIGTEESPIQITAYRDIGGIIGAAQSVNTGIDGNNNSISGNSASNVIIAIDQNYNGYDGSKTTNVGKIIGRIMGGTSDINSVVENVVCHVYGITALQNVVDDTETNSVFKEFTLAEDIIGDLTVTQKLNVQITINGNEKIFEGSIIVDGKSERYETAGLIIKNTQFVDNYITAAAYINLGDGFQSTRYTNNVTVQDCTFSYVGKRNDVVAVKSYTGGDFNLKLIGCTVNKGMHSALQVANVEKGLVIEGCKIYTIEGINLNNTPKAIVKDCEFDTDYYAIRVGVEGSKLENADYQITGGTLKSRCVGQDGAVIILRGTSDVESKMTVTDAKIEGNTWINKNGNDMIVEIDGSSYVGLPDSLAKILTSNSMDINVVLVDDVNLPISSLGQITAGSGEYKLGGEDTEKITIDLGGKKLNITTTYWSVIGAKNVDATITIKNGTMTSSQLTGTWNSYDLIFANCNYVIEDVTFEKAIAFENVGRSATIKNVLIKETHDYYAMWITAEGQNITIDGLTVDSDGRGIKIDEQYVGSPEKVTLSIENSKFTTKSKSAIIVKSVEGAKINWGGGNDISHVAADSTNPVWVDEDSSAYADKVIVSGGSVIVEP